MVWQELMTERRLLGVERGEEDRAVQVSGEGKSAVGFKQKSCLVFT